MIKDPISLAGKEHTDWLKSLDFFSDELDILQFRLTEFSKGSHSPDSLRMMEHFQNQFILQRNHIDELRHAVKEHAVLFGNELKLHKDSVSSSLDRPHMRLRDSMESFEKIILDLRKECNRYLVNEP